MTTPTGPRTPQTRSKLSPGDKAAVIVGAILTLYALGWFTWRTVQGLTRDWAVAPAVAPLPR